MILQCWKMDSYAKDEQDYVDNFAVIFKAKLV